MRRGDAIGARGPGARDRLLRFDAALSRVRAALDLDSRSPAAFGRAEASRLEALLDEVFTRRPGVVW